MVGDGDRGTTLEVLLSKVRFYGMGQVQILGISSCPPPILVSVRVRSRLGFFVASVSVESVLASSSFVGGCGFFLRPWLTFFLFCSGMSATTGENLADLGHWLGAETYQRAFRPIALKEYLIAACKF